MGGSLTRSSDTGNYSSAFVTAQFNQAYAAGSYAYRHSAAKAIEYGLEHLTNDVVGEVTATKSKSSGKILLNVNPANKLHARIAAGGSAVAFVSSGTTASGPAVGSVGVGDVFRVHSQDGMSQIEAAVEGTCAKADGTNPTTGTTTAFLDSATCVANSDCDSATCVYTATGVVTKLITDAEFIGHAADTAAVAANVRTSITADTNLDVGSVPIVDNGFKYKIKFEANSGDIPDLVCNTDNLRSVYRMDEAAYVSRDEPDRVWFVDTKQGSAQPAYSAVSQADMTHPSAITAGDTIYVGEQRCDVIASDSDMNAGLAAESSGIESYHSASVVCAQALSANSHSTADAICTHDVIEVSFEGSTQSCTSTDRPALRFIHDKSSGTSTDDCVDSSACAEVLAYNGANRLVRWSSGFDIAHLSTNELMDNNDLAVNDRVSIRTLNDHTYETRTVDYINLQGIGASTDNYFTVSQPFTAAHKEKRIFLNFKGTTTSAACSGRGLCDGSTAECQCFKGYTGQACQIQNALAA